MSMTLEPQIRASIEVTYSQVRKREMAAVKETNCSLLITDLHDILTKNGVTNITTKIPKGKARFTDIIIEFDVKSERDLERLENTIRREVGDSIDKIDVFVEDDDE